MCTLNVCEPKICMNVKKCILCVALETHSGSSPWYMHSNSLLPLLSLEFCVVFVFCDTCSHSHGIYFWLTFLKLLRLPHSSDLIVSRVKTQISYTYNKFIIYCFIRINAEQATNRIGNNDKFAAKSVLQNFLCMHFESIKNSKYSSFEIDTDSILFDHFCRHSSEHRFVFCFAQSQKFMKLILATMNAQILGWSFDLRSLELLRCYGLLKMVCSQRNECMVMEIMERIQKNGFTKGILFFSRLYRIKYDAATMHRSETHRYVHYIQHVVFFHSMEVCICECMR